jgi:hypothetical protein
MKACRFTFDETPAFDGFTDGTTWNGFDNVWVTPEVIEIITAYFRSHDDPETATELEQLPMGFNGLICLGYGYATQITND